MDSAADGDHREHVGDSDREARDAARAEAAEAAAAAEAAPEPEVTEEPAAEAPTEETAAEAPTEDTAAEAPAAEEAPAEAPAEEAAPSTDAPAEGVCVKLEFPEAGLAVLRADFPALFFVGGGAMIWGAWKRNGSSVEQLATLPLGHAAYREKNPGHRHSSM